MVGRRAAQQMHGRKDAEGTKRNPSSNLRDQKSSGSKGGRRREKAT